MHAVKFGDIPAGTQHGYNHKGLHIKYNKFNLLIKPFVISEHLQFIGKGFYMENLNYKEIYRKRKEEIEKAMSPKDMRKIHKKYKKYGLGIPLPDRYPYFPTIFSLIVLLLVLLSEFLHYTI